MASESGADQTADHQVRLPSARPRGPFARGGPPLYFQNILQARLSTDAIGKIQEVIHDCGRKGIPLLLQMEEKLYQSDIVKQDCEDKSGYSLINLEAALLHLSAVPNLCRGSVYWFAVKVTSDEYIIRYYESGAYRGFCQHHKKEIAKQLRVSPCKVYLWQLYTDVDRAMDVQRKDSKTAPSTLYRRLVETNVNSIKRLLGSLTPCVSNEHLFLHINRKCVKDDTRYTYLTEPLLAVQEAWDDLLTEYLIQGKSPRQVNTFMLHILDMPTETKEQQISLLSSISNFHWHKTEKSQSDHVTFAQHLLFSPSSHEDIDGNWKYKHPPTSPRNCLMLGSLNSTQATGKTYQMLKCLYSYDQIEDKTPDDLQNFVHTGFNNETFAGPPKKRKYKARVISATPRMVADRSGVDLPENRASQDRTIYTEFCENLVTDGLIMWRAHTDSGDVFLMNAYDQYTAEFLPSSFAHVTSTFQENSWLVRCDCPMYAHIQNCSIANIVQDDREELFLDLNNLTCLHCRFFSERLLPIVRDWEEGGEEGVMVSGALAEKVKQSVSNRDDAMVLVGPASKDLVTKLSVEGDEGYTYSLVHFTFVRGQCFAKCKNGKCEAQLINKKKIPKVVDLNRLTTGVCTHLRYVGRNIEFVKSLFPDYFDSEDVDQAQNAPLDNRDDVEIRDVHSSVFFDLETGMWQNSAHSKHTPLEMFDPRLISKTGQRLELGAECMSESGCLEGPDLVPQHLQQDGNPVTCQCGSTYQEDVYPDFKTKVFTRNYVMDCNVRKRKCSRGLCELKYSGQQDGIFFLSSVTAIADEVGWDFVSLVKSCKVSFSGFCMEMSRKYQTTNQRSHPFVSCKTWVKWFFAWVSAMRIDFRRDVDPWCGHDPEILACDGTHIGVSVKLQNLQRPVTDVDRDEIVNPKHKRAQRVFMKNYPKERKHLRYLCREMLHKKHPQKEKLTDEEELQATIHLKESAQNIEGGTGEFVKQYVSQELDGRMMHLCSKLLHVLVSRGEVSCIFPLGFHPLLLDLCDLVETGGDFRGNIEWLTGILVELKDVLLCESADRTLLVSIAKMVREILVQIEETHSNDRETEPASSIAGSYNPPGGTSYYFSKSGEQLRTLPKYAVQKDGDLLEETICTKVYPQVSYGGYGYLMAFFCPIHGHCYGFHLIAGGEGRKDAFAALWKFKPSPPQHIFYDFACQLAEYCLNREPHFFKQTRFWHDTFHSFNHTCGNIFKSARVTGLEG